MTDSFLITVILIIGICYALSKILQRHVERSYFQLGAFITLFAAYIFYSFNFSSQDWTLTSPLLRIGPIGMMIGGIAMVIGSFLKKK